MSALGGIFCRNGTPMPMAELEALELSLRNQGPDGGDVAIVASAGLVHRALHITPESHSIEQPVSRGHIVVTWDGRLDNRDDLLLQLKPNIAITDADEVLVAEAWIRWGANCVRSLIGEWALAAFDIREKRLYLARDYAGTCPLFYRADAQHTVWSSQLSTFLVPVIQQLQGGPLRLDEAWIAGYFGGFGGDLGSTVYSEVRSVRPGYLVAIDRDHVAVRQYWAFDAGKQIRYRSDHEYEEEFRYLLRQAVKRRLRANGTVVAQLSGGLDSSSLVCMADSILEGEGAAATNVTTMSATFPDSPESDEVDFISCIESTRGQFGLHFSDKDYPIVSLHPYKIWPASPSFFDCFAIRERAICDAMDDTGSRIQMSGEGGDELLGNIGEGIPNLQDLLYEQALGRFWRELSQWSAANRRSIWNSTGILALTYLPSYVQMRLEKELRPLIALISRPFECKHSIRTSAIGHVDEYGFVLPSQKSRSEALMSVIKRVSGVVFRRVGNVHVTFPYLDRSLVSFLLSVPADQMTRPGQRRSLMRRSCAAIVPKKVLARRSKRSPQSALYRGLIRELPNIRLLLAAPLVCAYGFVDPEALSRTIPNVQNGTFPSTIFAQVIMLELWLRAREQGKLQGMITPQRVCADLPVTLYTERR